MCAKHTPEEPLTMRIARKDNSRIKSFILSRMASVHLINIILMHNYV